MTPYPTPFRCEHCRRYLASDYSLYKHKQKSSCAPFFENMPPRCEFIIKDPEEFKSFYAKRDEDYEEEEPEVEKEEEKHKPPKTVYKIVFDSVNGITKEKYKHAIAKDKCRSHIAKENCKKKQEYDTLIEL